MGRRSNVTSVWNGFRAAASAAATAATTCIMTAGSWYDGMATGEVVDDVDK